MKTIIYSILLILLLSSKLNGQTISDYNLLIVDGYESSSVKTELEALGHTVVIENSMNLTTDYDYSNYDTIIFLHSTPQPPGISEILSLNTNNQLGIILMRGENIINSSDMGNLVTWSNTDFTIEDNSHFITQPFSLGTLDLGFTYKSNLRETNSGNTILGSVSSGNGSLVVNDTYRRVFCPYYGHQSGMPWSTDAEVMTDRIIAWTSSTETLNVTGNISVEKIKAFPNPATSYISIQGDADLDSYTLYDMLGKVVENGVLSNKKQISIQHLSRGMYFLKFNNGTTAKFLKN